ncbi:MULTISPECIES: hypothetical protein [Rhodopseudomonas]|uniref:Uncharacterized protein n=1 Tax=Rhodopseudomonas palustris TaxID=1076 RepID=A0A0D7E0I5_RHOPL|nr:MULTISPECIES: hypothetical protein [Rhodopseudomonas]KIZ33172.1 hypothetical protein OO17_28765 [Rhodopseudomonas palustris]MDF3814512.1 hypothetical protein [Rhodopseudomonas sp. BAL398]WOK19340.1 hypothetical protein RBJ75_07445 [Rhodopseudomonas sp. BAL398]
MSSRRRSDQPPTDPMERDGGPVEAAGYISEAIADLLHLARIHRLEMLAYLLEMALLEAQEMVRLRRTPPPQQPGE